MKKETIILFITIGLLSFTTITEVDEQTKFKMFCEAFKNFSTAPNYIVAKVKNLKTGEKKEVCTEAPSLNGAIYYETGDFYVGLDCKKYKERYFEFSKDSALWDISFDLYSKADLDNYAKTINVANIVQQVKSGQLQGKIFGDSEKEQTMFAHLMFNNGVMMTRGCLAGNICGLTYFETKK